MTGSRLFFGNISATGAYALDADAASYVWTAAAAALEHGYVLVPDAASYTWTATDATLTRDIPLSADAAAYAWTAQAAGLEFGRQIVADAAAYSWGASAAAVEHGRLIDADAAAYLWTASDVDLIYSPLTGSYNLDVGPSVFVWAATDVDLIYAPVASTDQQPAGGWQRYKTPRDLRLDREDERRRLSIEAPAQRKIDKAAKRIAKKISDGSGLTANVSRETIVAQPQFDALLAALQPSEGQILALADAILARIAWMIATQAEQDEEDAAIVLFMMEL